MNHTNKSLVIVLMILFSSNLGISQIRFDLSIDTTNYNVDQTIVAIPTIHNDLPDSVCLKFYSTADYWIMIDGDTVKYPSGLDAVWDLSLTSGDSFQITPSVISYSSYQGTHFLQASLGNVDLCDSSGVIENILSNVVTISMHDPSAISSDNNPTKQLLITNYPNPFNPSTSIEYDLPEQMDVILTVHDISGRTVSTLVKRTMIPGHYEDSWDGTDTEGRQVVAGMYFARLQAGEYSSVVKMIYLR